MSKGVRTTARAIISFEIICPSTWSEDTEISQIKKQAEEDALAIIHNMTEQKCTKPYVTPMTVKINQVIVTTEDK